MHVYVQSNDADANEVIVFRRGKDGRLERGGSFETGGKGTGKPHLASQSSVVVAGDRVFVTNAGSDDVSVFSIDGDPAQVAFSPDGRTLVVTDRATDSIHVFAVEDGVIAERPQTYPSSGATPYGFDFTADGKLVVTEAAGAQIGKASASSYALAAPAQLNPVSGPIGNTRSEVCWAVIGKDGRYAYVTNFGDGTISTYEIGRDGSLSLREAVAATTYEGEPGLRDEALTEDGQFLYALHADRQRIFAWEVGRDGSLAALGSTDGLPATAAGLAVH
jgi:6-phosphogluconolactonase (cycloisomerase 2 family)